MKTCPACGQDADDRFLYCPDDGSALGDLQSDGDVPITEKRSTPSPSRVSVLFCPACEGEYPLTFASCPIDGLKLTRERRRLKSSRPAEIEVAPSLAPPPPRLSIPSPDPVPFQEADSATYYDSNGEGLSDEEPFYDDDSSATGSDSGLIEKIRSDRLSFRIAAIATIIGLALFGLSAVYRLYTYGVKKPSASAPVATSGDKREAPPSFIIETPKEAREYVEEKTEIPAPDQPPEQAAKQPERPAPPPPARLKEVSAPVAPHSTGGRVRSRLDHIRANRTPSGYRYDLTFTLHELGGRPVRWNSLTISARSASGVNHLQAIPFNQRLGPSGKLTFTVTVDLTGRSKPDWQGRIVCTAVGSDFSGEPLKATFGANVSP